jgi:hypothetical protein
MRSFLAACFLNLVLCAPFSSLVRVCSAEDESLSQKAASQVLDSLPDFVKDVQAMRNRTPQQKIDFLMSNVDSRVKEKVGEKFKDQIKDKVKEYTQAAVRARAFQEIGVPQLRNAIVMGTAPDWGKIETSIASNVDTKMRMFDAGWKAAEIGWGAYEAYSSGDAVAAAKSISGSVCDLLAEAYIPGWGWVKFGAKMVEALGNYVLSYATDTAIQGMLENMYGLKSNPAGLADWLIKQSPQAIKADIDGKWNDGMAFGYLWQGQGTDKGDEEMKSRLQSALVSLRGELLVKIKEEEAKEREIQQYMEKYKQEAEQKAQALQAAAKQAVDEAERILAPVKAFRQKYYGLRKQEVKTQESVIQSQMQGGGGIAYSPLNRTGLLTIYKTALDEVKEGPSKTGFDKATYEQWSNDYGPAVKKELERFVKANEDAIQAAGKTMWDAWGPQFAALQSQLDAAYKRGDNDAVRSINQQLQALNDRFAPVQAAFGKAVGETRTKMALDQQLLQKEWELLSIEAAERGAKFGGAISEAYKKINERLAVANAELGIGLQTLRQNLLKLNYPSLWRGGGVQIGTGGSLGGGYSGPARQLRDGEYEFFTGPGHLAGALAAAEEEARKLREDMTHLNELDAFERKLYSSYRQVVANCFNEYLNITPSKLQVVHKPPIFSGNQEQNRNNSLTWAARSGNPTAMGEEVWAMGDFPYVSYPGGHVGIQGVLVPLEFLNKIDQYLGNASEPYQKALEQVQKDITSLQGWAQIDELAGIINQLGPKLERFLGPYAYYGEGVPGVIYKFRALPEDKGGAGVRIDERTVLDTAGYAYLKEMKAAWEKHGYRVEQFANLARGYGQGHKYPQDSDPKRFINKLPAWQGIPQKIKVYEDAMAQAIKESTQAYDAAKKQLDELKDQFKKERSGAGGMTLKNMQNVQKMVKLIVKHNLAAPGYAVLKDDILAFEKEVDEGIESWLAEQKRRTEEYQRQQEAESKAAAAAARKKEEEDNLRRLKDSGQLAGMYGYALVNPRLNTVSLAQAAGEVVLMRNDLLQGGIEITARMATMDKARAMLFSEDNGRTWKELPLSSEIRYSFVPLPNKQYQPILRVKTDDGNEVDIKVFHSVQWLVFRDMDFTQLVAESVKNLADSYEAKNFAAFSRLVSDDFLGNKAFLEDGVRMDFDLFSDIRLKIYINRIEKSGGYFVADTKWDKQQSVKKTGQQQSTSGRTTMVFALEEGKMRIKNLRGNLIYATLSPEIAQSSGLPSSTVDQIRTANEDRNPVQPGAGTTEDAGGTSSGSSSSTSTTKSLRVTSPNGGENWAQSSTQDITWTSSGVSNIKIEQKEGGIWFEVEASVSAASGVYSWNLPPVTCNDCRIRITDTADASVTDTSDADFTIF